MKSVCNICNQGNGLKKITTNLGYFYLCTYCDFTHYNLELGPSEIYDSQYFTDGPYPKGYSQQKEVLQNDFYKDIKILENLGIKCGKLLDVGCAYGYFLDLFSRKRCMAVIWNGCFLNSSKSSKQEP